MEVAFRGHHEERCQSGEGGADGHAGQDKRGAAGPSGEGGQAIDQEGGQDGPYEGKKGDGVYPQRGEGSPNDPDRRSEGRSRGHAQQVGFGQSVAEDPLEGGARGGQRGPGDDGQGDTGEAQIQEQAGGPLGEVAAGIAAVSDQGEEGAEGLTDRQAGCTNDRRPR